MLLSCQNNTVFITLTREWYSNKWNYSLVKRDFQGDTICFHELSIDYGYLVNPHFIFATSDDSQNGIWVRVFQDDIMVWEKYLEDAFVAVPAFVNHPDYLVFQIINKGEKTTYDQFILLNTKKKNEERIEIKNNTLFIDKRIPDLCFAYISFENNESQIKVVDIGKGETNSVINIDDLESCAPIDFETCRMIWKDSSRLVFSTRNMDTDNLSFYIYDIKSETLQIDRTTVRPPIDFSLEQFSFYFLKEQLYLLGDEGIYIQREGFSRIISSDNIVDFIVEK